MGLCLANVPAVLGVLNQERTRFKVHKWPSDLRRWTRCS
jgi:hypothetical protein